MRRTPKIAVLSALTAGALVLTAAPAMANEEPPQVPEPSSFTSMFTVMAVPDTVVDMEGQPAPGEPGATGEFNYRINSDEEIICYDLTLRGVTGEYESPAVTATHIHEAAQGEAGPPRIAFPNPQGDDTMRTSSGCIQGPFTTGVTNDETGQDQGQGFTLAQIEANPSAFMGDTHTAEFTPGTVRGQLMPVPMGGPETGAGATASTQGGVSSAAVMLGAGALVAAAGAGAVVARRRSQA